MSTSLTVDGQAQKLILNPVGLVITVLHSEEILAYLCTSRYDNPFIFNIQN
uniref:Uncharacterized protein n=1 Tax=Manihot esculenta TaxID=3983 RepID=A0A2C9VBB2_MANES